MPLRADPTLPPDDQARALARDLIATASHAALAVTDAATGTPGISRISFGRDGAGVPLTLVSALAPHAAALLAHPDCAFMLGDPGPRGDPLSHPRLMVRARAEAVAQDDPDRNDLRGLWLRDHPKSAVYIDFADFSFMRLRPVSALLNAGFARAFRLTPADLGI